MAGSKKPRADAQAMGRRIAEYREKRGLTQKGLGAAVGVTFQSVQQWEEGRTQPRPSHLPRLSAALGVSVHALLHDVSDHESVFNEAVPIPGRPREIPLVSSCPAGAPSEQFDQRVAEVREPTHRTFYPVSRSAFALRVHGDSMEPLFPDGCIITVEPTIPPQSAMFMVVRLDASSEHTFKQLIIDGPHRFLKPVNTRYPIIELTEGAIICGVVVEHHQTHVPGVNPWQSG